MSSRKERRHLHQLVTTKNIRATSCSVSQNVSHLNPFRTNYRLQTAIGRLDMFCCRNLIPNGLHGGNYDEITLGSPDICYRPFVWWFPVTNARNYFYSNQSGNRGIETGAYLVALAIDRTGYRQTDWLARVASYAQTLYRFRLTWLHKSFFADSFGSHMAAAIFEGPHE